MYKVLTSYLYHRLRPRTDYKLFPVHWLHFGNSFGSRVACRRGVPT